VPLPGQLTWVGATVTKPSPYLATLAANGSVLLRVGLALILLSMLSLSPSVAETAGAPPGSWLLTRNTAMLMAQADPSVAERFFGTGESTVLGGWSGAGVAKSWPSYASFATDVATGHIPASIRVVMYDPEGWAATPLRERQDPARYMRAFSELAHRHGYAVILTPHPNLTTVPGSVCQEQPGESMEAAYLRCRIPGIAARYADTLDVQAQILEGDPGRYAEVVDLATRQARDANPHIVVVSQLSTTFSSNAGVLFSAWSAVQGVVDGHYLGVPGGFRADVALEFLQMVDQRSA
jgi:hypothetical protein